MEWCILRWIWDVTQECKSMTKCKTVVSQCCHDDVIKWKHFPRNWPFVRGIHRSPVNSPHKGQWRVALMFSLIWVWINGWVNNHKAGDLRLYRFHYDVTVMHWAIDIVDEPVMERRISGMPESYTTDASEFTTQPDKFQTDVWKVQLFQQHIRYWFWLSSCRPKQTN